jgi:hypothetical protein
MRQTTRRAKSSNLPIFQSSNLPAGSLSHDAKSSGADHNLPDSYAPNPPLESLGRGADPSGGVGNEGFITPVGGGCRGIPIKNKGGCVMRFRRRKYWMQAES